MTKANVTNIRVVGFIILVLFSLGCQEYDCFNCCQLGIATDRSEYDHNDVITLTATVTPRRPSRIQLYSDREKSFCIFLRSMAGDSVDFEDSDFLRCSDATAPDLIDTVEFSPATPFVLSVEGHIIVESDKSIRFDFGQFGSFMKPHGGEFLIGGYWKPIHPDPSDSQEDYTETVLISVRSRP